MYLQKCCQRQLKEAQNGQSKRPTEKKTMTQNEVKRSPNITEKGPKEAQKPKKKPKERGYQKPK